MPDSTHEIIDAWPTCPQCQAPRNAQCRMCGAARDFFPPAYQVEETGRDLRFCSSCDDVAELEYFRECHQCGYDYGEGYLPPIEHPAENETRAWWVLGVLVVGGALLAGYFYWLLRR